MGKYAIVLDSFRVVRKVTKWRLCDICESNSRNKGHFKSVFIVNTQKRN